MTRSSAQKVVDAAIAREKREDAAYEQKKTVVTVAFVGLLGLFLVTAFGG